MLVALPAIRIHVLCFSIFFSKLLNKIKPNLSHFLLNCQLSAAAGLQPAAAVYELLFILFSFFLVRFLVLAVGAVAFRQRMVVLGAISGLASGAGSF